MLFITLPEYLTCSTHGNVTPAHTCSIHTYTHTCANLYAYYACGRRYVYTCVHACMLIYRYFYKFTDSHTHIDVRTHNMFINIYLHTYIYIVHKRTYMNVHRPTYIHEHIICIQTYIIIDPTYTDIYISILHTHRYKYISTYKHIYIHIHTYIGYIHIQM